MTNTPFKPCPRDPTEAMFAAGDAEDKGGGDAAYIWQAMYDAAPNLTPSPPSREDVERVVYEAVTRWWLKAGVQPVSAGDVRSIAHAVAAALTRLPVHQRQEQLSIMGRDQTDENIGFVEPIQEGDAEANLVARFADALLAKLRASEEKHDWQRAWMKDDWQAALAAKIRRHADKGDPIDVAAYAAFAWHHGWSLSLPELPPPTSLSAYSIKGTLERLEPDLCGRLSAEHIQQALAEVAPSSPVEPSLQAREMLAAEYEDPISNRLADAIRSGAALTVSESSHIQRALRAIEKALSLPASGRDEILEECRCPVCGGPTMFSSASGGSVCSFECEAKSHD